MGPGTQCSATATFGLGARRTLQESLRSNEIAELLHRDATRRELVDRSCRARLMRFAGYPRSSQPRRC